MRYYICIITYIYFNTYYKIGTKYFTIEIEYKENGTKKKRLQ